MTQPKNDPAQSRIDPPRIPNVLDKRKMAIAVCEWAYGHTDAPKHIHDAAAVVCGHVSLADKMWTQHLAGEQVEKPAPGEAIAKRQFLKWQAADSHRDYRENELKLGLREAADRWGVRASMLSHAEQGQESAKGRLDGLGVAIARKKIAAMAANAERKLHQSSHETTTSAWLAVMSTLATAIEIIDDLVADEPKPADTPKKLTAIERAKRRVMREIEDARVRANQGFKTKDKNVASAARISGMERILVILCDYGDQQ